MRNDSARAFFVAGDRLAELNAVIQARKERLAQRPPIDLARNVATPLPGFEVEGKAVEFASLLVQEHERASLADHAGSRSNELVISRRQTGAKSIAPRLVNGEALSLPPCARPGIALKHGNQAASGGQRVREAQAAETCSDDDGMWSCHEFSVSGRDSLLLVIIREVIHHLE